jgi:hypothetical protein
MNPREDSYAHLTQWVARASREGVDWTSTDVRTGRRQACGKFDVSHAILP